MRLIFTFFIKICILIIALHFVCVTPAYAYIDPNTGGFFFQTVAPFVYGILAAIVIFWKRIMGFLKGLVSGNKVKDKSVNKN